MKIDKGILCAVTASLLWAMVNPLVKHGLAFGVPVLGFAGVRFMAAGIILLSFSWRRDALKVMARNWQLFLNLVAVNIFLGYSVFYIGLDMAPAGIASIVMGVSPLINVMLAHFIARDDRLTPVKVASLAVSLAGVILVIRTGGEDGHMLSLPAIAGIALLFANIAMQGYSAIRVAEAAGKPDPVFLNGVQMLLGGGLIYAAGICSEGFYHFTGLPGVFYLDLAALVGISVFAFSLWFYALQHEKRKVSDLNMCRLINPVVGAALSWLMLPDERPTVWSVSGMAVIVLSLIIYFRPRRSAVSSAETLTNGYKRI